MSEEVKIKILYVDDEMNNLISFKASFRLDYTIFTAVNTTDAFDILGKNPDIRIIICDQRMPDKTGVAFFEEVRSTYPNPIRILLTGYADIESVIDAINRSQIYRYIKKPWIESDITSAIGEANRYYITNSMISAKNEELQKAYNELDKFAYSVTHDIRAPLLSILGAIDVANYIDDIIEIRDVLRMMEDSVKNLDKYIQNIHDYYNLRRGELKIVEINVNKLARNQEDTFKLTAKLNRVRFIVDVLQLETFRCDLMSLNIIINNLLSNAFKYQRDDIEDKYVELVVRVEKGFATISIKDNGIGIPEKHIDGIFNMFFRATTNHVGSGLGLYNVKDALLKLNGEIAVDSKVNEGSCFTVVIPNK